MDKIKKIDLLTNFIERNRIVSSVDIQQWGLNNYFTTALRRTQELASKGEVVKRVSKWEKISRGLLKKGNKELAWFEWCKI